MSNFINEANNETSFMEERQRIANICFKKAAAADIVLTLSEVRYSAQGAPRVNDLDERISTKPVNRFYVTDDFFYLDMKFETKDKNEALAFRVLYKSFLDHQTQEFLKDSLKRYLLTYELVSIDKDKEVAYRMQLVNPCMCFMEEYNGDHLLHLIFLKDNVNFFEEKFDSYKIEEQIHYEQVEEEESGISFSSSSSELDEDFEDEE